MSRPYTQHPSYRAAKDMYLNDPGRPSLLEVARKLDIPPSTAHYWSQRESWKQTRSLMDGKAPAQKEKPDGRLAERSKGELDEILELLDGITEIRQASAEKIGEMMRCEGLERQRRYLVLMAATDVLAATVTRRMNPGDAEKLSRAIGNLLEKAQMLIGLPGRISETRDAPARKVRRAPRADVEAARMALGLSSGESQEAPAVSIAPEDDEAEENAHAN